MVSQETIVKDWNGRAERYSEIIHRELDSFKAKAWTDIILEEFPKDKELKVLDVGTGPGFFSIILSRTGHKVTAIDCTENMVNVAKQNFKEMDVSPEIYLMDSHNPDFPDNTFDLIVNRNVTWTLYEPKKAYTEWFRILKPGGKLIIFDANWFLPMFDEELAKKDKKVREECLEKYGDPYGGKDGNKHRGHEYAKDMPLSNVVRPDWDIEALNDIGFSEVKAELDIREGVYDEREKLLYTYTPLFKLVAVK